jgi:hypothetical protein
MMRLPNRLRAQPVAWSITGRTLCQTLGEYVCISDGNMNWFTLALGLMLRSAIELPRPGGQSLGLHQYRGPMGGKWVETQGLAPSVITAA